MSRRGHARQPHRGRMVGYSYLGITSCCPSVAPSPVFTASFGGIFRPTLSTSWHCHRLVISVIAGYTG